ncbi:MAG: aminomethyltransferase family protein [bacterium]
MLRTTPFFERLAPMSQSQAWGNWLGYQSALRYDLSSKHECFAVRNSAGLFDTSPLRKYWIRGRDAERFCSYVFARDVRAVKPGRAQYTVWCDDAGFVMEDGVIFRFSSDEFLLTAAEPNLGYLRSLARPFEVEIIDASDDYASLALQGPRSRAILEALTPDVGALRYFGFTETKVADAPVVLSRTGFSGDLGYELLIPAGDALRVLDALLEAGAPHGLRPYGDEALGMTRIEAGLPLIKVEFTSSRYAFTPDERFTPDELGLGWLLKGIDDPARPFIGRAAILRERAEGTSRWSTVGITVSWRDYFELFDSHGLPAEPNEVPAPWDTMVYNANGKRVGYATSFMYSPVLQCHIGIARLKPKYAQAGTEVFVEQTVNHEYINVRATVTTLPFYNPERKTA